MATALIQVKPEALQQIATKHADLLQQAQSLTVRDDASYRSAGELALAIKALRDEITRDFKPAKDAAYKAHRAICAQETKHLEELQTPDKIVRAKLSAWDTEQQRIREQREQEARDKARREAEERQLQEAIAAEQRGDKKRADFLMTAPVIPEAVEQVAAPQRVSGIAFTEKWTYKVTNEALIPREFLMIDHTTLRKHVELMGESAKVAGVDVFKVKSTRIGGRIAEPKPVQSETTDVTADEVFG